MNLVIVLLVAAGAVALLWAVQSLSLRLAGQPLALPLQYTTRDPLVRWTGRVMVQLTWIVILVGAPLALGIRPLDALQQAWPFPPPWRAMALAFALMLLPMPFLFGSYVKIGWLQFQPQHDPKRRRAKLMRRFLGPIPLAIMEEGVFRGILLEQMLRTVPQTPAWTVIAIVVTAAVFSSVHFVRPGWPGKPVLQPAWGLFVAGCLFGATYVLGGRGLWLPVVLHASAIFGVEVTKLYVTYRGPAWLIGYADWPYCGVVGTVYVLCVGVALAALM